MALSFTSLVWSATRYETDPVNLAGAEWAAGDSVYVDDTTLLLTNNVASAVGSAFGSVVEAPDIEEDGDRLVFRVTATDDELRESVYRASQSSQV